MTLEEKVGQMDQIVIGKLRDTTAPADGNCNNGGGNGDPLQTSCLQRVLIDYKTGSILSGGTDNPADNTGRGWAEQYNTIQHYAVEHSRLHIPIIYGVDAVHGFGHPFQAPLFPHSIGTALHLQSGSDPPHRRGQRPSCPRRTASARSPIPSSSASSLSPACA